MTRPLLSIVVPTYRGSATLPILVERLKAVLEPLVSGAWQIVLVNDGSPDDSWNLIEKLCAEDKRVAGVSLMRNFGQHNAIMAGLRFAQGDYIVTMDDDLQNPPEEIPALFKEIQQGWDVVYGVIETQKKHAWHRNLGSRMVLGTFKWIFDVDVNITSFRILRRTIAQEILSYRRSFTFVDGVIAWHTKKIGSVAVDHHARLHGESGYSMAKLLTLTINMLTNFSLIPLQIATMLGFIFSLFGFSLASYFMVKKLFMDIPVSGFSSTIVTVTLLSGVQLLTVGVLGEYIGRIHINISNRPQYIIRSILNHQNPDVQPNRSSVEIEKEP